MVDRQLSLDPLTRKRRAELAATLTESMSRGFEEEVFDYAYEELGNILNDALLRANHRLYEIMRAQRQLERETKELVEIDSYRAYAELIRRFGTQDEYQIFSELRDSPDVQEMLADNYDSSDGFT